MDKKEEFKKWISDEIKKPTNNSISDELRFLEIKCDGEMWDIKVAQRDLDNRTAMYIMRDFPNDNKDRKAAAYRFTATTMAMRKLKELEAAQ